MPAGATTLQAFAPLGLHLEVLKDSPSGGFPENGRRVTLQYTGHLNNADGHEFDSNDGLTVRVGRGQVISGWDAALPYIACGQSVRLTVPPGLAYGARGKPPTIPPQSTLVFDMKMLAIEIDTPDDTLLDAASQGDAQALTRALRAGASAAYADRKGATALHAAASGGHAECVMRLLEAGVYTLDVNAVQSQPKGVTALMLAVRSADLLCVELLMTARASAELQSAKGNSAHSMAAKDPAMAAVLQKALQRAANGSQAPTPSDEAWEHDLGIGETIAPWWEPVRCLSLMQTRVRSNNPRCWFKIVCEQGTASTPAADTADVPLVVVELWADAVPKTADNFRCLCTGEKGACSAFGSPPLHYKGNVAHRIVPGQILQAGDITSGDGKGGESIYGRKFDDESFAGRAGRHRSKGLLSMANSGRNSNGSQFFITLAEMSHLDGKHVVFGRVVQGMEYVEAIANAAGAASGVPSRRVTIADCGQC